MTIKDSILGSISLSNDAASITNETIKDSILGSIMLSNDAASITSEHMKFLHQKLECMVSELNHLDYEDATSSERYIAQHLIDLGYMRKTLLTDPHTDDLREEFVATN
jgi:hypothetical protein